MLKTVAVQFSALDCPIELGRLLLLLLLPIDMVWLSPIEW